LLQSPSDILELLLLDQFKSPASNELARNSAEGWRSHRVRLEAVLNQAGVDSPMAGMHAHNPGRHDSRDFKGSVINPNRPAENVPATPELPLPEAIAEDNRRG